MSIPRPVSPVISSRIFSFVLQRRQALERAALCVTGILVATMAVAGPVGHSPANTKDPMTMPAPAAAPTPIPQVVVSAKRWNEVQKAQYDAAEAARAAQAARFAKTK